MIRNLTQTDFALYTDEIEQGHKVAQLRGASSYESLSLLEYLKFLIEMLQNEIRISRRLGVISYPSLLLEHNGRLFPVTIDYFDHGTMVSEILSIFDKTLGVSC